MNFNQELKKALSHHQANRLDQARDAYVRLNRLAPHHPDPLHLLGVIAYQTGEYHTALELIKRAIDIDSENSAYYNNLGNAYKEIGRFDDSVSCYKKAIELTPEYAAAYFDLGNAYQELGQLDEAISAYRSALKIKPEMAEAHNNLGIGLYKSDQLDQAIVHFKNALQLKPDYLEACTNTGNAYKKLARFGEAIDFYDQAISISPACFEAYSQMGHALQSLGRLEDACINYQSALRLRPVNAELHNCLGSVYIELGRLKPAMDCLNKSRELNPQDPEPYCNLGIVYRKQGRFEEAISSYQKALKLRPDFSEALYNLANIFGRCGQSAKAIDCYRHVLQLNPDHTHALSLMIRQLQQICAWQELPEPLATLGRQTEAILAKGHKSPPMPFLTVSISDDPRHNFEIAKLWARDIQTHSGEPAHCRSAKTRGADSNDHRRTEKQRLTIGYLSADFRNHATAHLMLSLFGYHDRKLFKINGYSYGRDDHSEYRRRIENDCDQFVDLASLNHFDAARSINRDAVDILVDLKGYTDGNRLEICAHKPAPVQVSYLGFPGTSGADFFDYIITDRIVTPPDQASFFSEKFAYMPHCYQVNNCHQAISDKKFKRRDFGLPERGFVFCSLNELYKIEPVMFAVWMEMLQKVPNSVLWLLHKNQASVKNLRNEARRKGVEPDRLLFAEKLPKAEHLARLKLADLYLDTRIYNGHTTISDALWAGVPGITLQGKHFASRVAASILTAAGLPELITFSLSEYKDLAVQLAFTSGLLSNIVEKLAHNRLQKPLYDTPRFARYLEKGFEKMWQIYLSGETPRQFDVSTVAQDERFSGCASVLGVN